MSASEALIPPAPSEATVALIQDRSVEGLGETALVCVYPERVHGQYTGRWHEQHTVELDEHKHSVLVTNPSAIYSQTDAFFHPGFTQTTDEPGGLGFTFHTEFARRMPHIRVASIASTGIGRFGDRVHRNTRQLATMEAMAEQRFRLMQAIGGDRRKQLLGLSMGTVINTLLVQHDLDDNLSLGITADFKYVPAVVTPERVAEDMKRHFGPHVMVDCAREVVDGRNRLDPRKMVATIRSLSHLGLGWTDFPALAVQAMSLSTGTELPLVKNDTRNYQVAVVAGEKDPLTQKPMWDTEQQENPSNVSLRVIRGRGHGMAVDAVGGAAQAAHTLQRIDPAA